MIRINIILLFIISFNGILCSQNKSSNNYENIADTIVSSSLMERKGYNLLKEFCKIGPRLSGSENSYKAIAWAEEKMKALGFDSVWLQPVMVPRWVRNDVEKLEIISPQKDLKIAALGGSIGTSKEGITGEILEVKSFAELEEKKENVRNKVVFFNNIFDEGKLNTMSAYGEASKIRYNAASEAVKYGALGVIIKSITTKKDNVPHTGSTRIMDNISAIPSTAIGFEDGDYLSDALKENPQLKVNLKLNCSNLPDTLSYNLIADLIGTEKPEEIIVVAGHLDSWDVGDGAHDAASGCIQALEVVDLFKRLNINPKRTIRCIFYINEENGVRGGRKYGEYSESAGVKHIAAIESDRGAFTPEGFQIKTDTITFNKIKEWLPILKKAGIEWVKIGDPGVDISFIKNAKALINYVPDDQRYFDFHHSANDVFEEIHPREFELGTAAIAILTYLISEEGL